MEYAKKCRIKFLNLYFSDRSIQLRNRIIDDFSQKLIFE